MIVDAHVHIPQEKRDRKSFIDSYDKDAIKKVILLPLGKWSYFPTLKEVEFANREVYEFVKENPGKYEWLVYVNPQHKSAPQQVERWVKKGAIGVKLWVSLKDKHGRMPQTLEVLKMANQLNCPVLIHTYNRIDENLPGEISVEEFKSFADELPNLKIIAAHSGANWQESLGVIGKHHKNVYFDLSGVLPSSNMVSDLVKELGEDKIIFGSDMYGRDFYSQLSKVTLAPISNKAKEKVLWKNANKVFSLDLKKESFEKQEKVKNIRFKEDHFCFYGQWPIMDCHHTETQSYISQLQKNNIKKYFMGNLNSILSCNLHKENLNFYKTIRKHKEIIPLATLNPRAHNSLSMLHNLKSMNWTNIILFPGFHNWSLDDPKYDSFFNLCHSTASKLWINIGIGDERFYHYSLKYTKLETEQIVNFIKKYDKKIQITFQGMGFLWIKQVLKHFRQQPNCQFDCSRTLDYHDHHMLFLNRKEQRNFVFGSEFPIKHCQSNLVTLQEKLS